MQCRALRTLVLAIAGVAAALSAAGPSAAVVRASDLTAQAHPAPASLEPRKRGRPLAELEQDLGDLKLQLRLSHERQDGRKLDSYSFTFKSIPVLGLGVRVVHADDETEVVDWLRVAPEARSASHVPAVSRAKVMEIAAAVRAERMGQNDAEGRGAADVARAPSLAFEAEVSPDPTEDEARILERLRLTWRVELYRRATDLFPTEIAVLDAQTGELVRLEPGAVTVDPDPPDPEPPAFPGPAVAIGQGFYSRSKDLTVWQKDDAGTQCLADVVRKLVPVTPTNPCFAWSGVAGGIHTFIERTTTTGTPVPVRATDTDGIFGNNSFCMTYPADEYGEPGRTEAADAHYAVGRAYDFFNRKLGRRLLGAHDRVKILVNTKAQVANAGWEFASDTILVGEKATSGPFATTKKGPSATPEVLGHEYTHGLIFAHIGQPFPNTQFGALHEGIADIFGTLIEAYADAPESPGIADPLNWVHGDSVWKPNTNGVRYFDLPSRDGQDPCSPYPCHTSPDLYNNQVQQAIATGLDPHWAGAIVRRAFYFLSKGAAPLQSGAPNTSPNLSDGMTGIGVDSAARLLYDAVTTQFSPGAQPTFMDMRNAMMRAAGDVCGDKRQAVMNAWAAVGVGQRPDKFPPTFTMTVSQEEQLVVVDISIETKPDDPLYEASLFLDWVAAPQQPSLQPTGYTLAGDLLYHSRLELPLSSFSERTLNKVQLQVTDGRADNCGLLVSKEVSIAIDRTGPRIYDPVDLNLERSSVRTFRIRAADPAKVRTIKVYLVNQAMAVVQGPDVTADLTLDLSTVFDGPTFLVVKAQDSYGNWSQLLFPYYVDHTPPGPTADYPGGFKIERSQNSNNVRPKVEVADAGTVVRLEVDRDSSVAFWWAEQGSPEWWHRIGHSGTVWSSGLTNTYVWEPLGEHEYGGRAIDSWGNTWNFPRQRIRMTPPPTVEVTYTVDPAARRLNVKVRARTTGEPMTRVQLRYFYTGLEDSVWVSMGCGLTDCLMQYQLPLPAGDVSGTLWGWAYDAAGAFTEGDDVPFTMDADWPPDPPSTPPSFVSFNESESTNNCWFSVFGNDEFFNVLPNQPAIRILGRESSTPGGFGDWDCYKVAFSSGALRVRASVPGSTMFAGLYVKRADGTWISHTNESASSLIDYSVTWSSIVQRWGNVSAVVLVAFASPDTAGTGVAYTVELTRSN